MRQRVNRKGKPWEGCLRYKDEGGKWRQATKVFPATVRSERQASIRRAFPSVKLCDLRTAQIQKWENSLTQSGKAPATVLKYHRLLAEVCKHAVAVRDLTWNPCDAVRVPKQRAPSPFPELLRADGVARRGLGYNLANTMTIYERSTRWR